LEHPYNRTSRRTLRADAAGTCGALHPGWLAAGDTVLDPFGGSGTTARAALALQRKAVLIDLGYQDMQARRTDGVQVELFV
jgi:hypothetical protein